MIKRVAVLVRAGLAHCRMLVVVVPVLGRYVTPPFQPADYDWKDEFAMSQSMLELRIPIEVYHRRYNEYPNVLDDLCDKEPVEGACTVIDPWGQRMPPGGRAKDWPILDPWGRPLSYRRVQGGYDLYSNGPDGLPMTADDILPRMQWGSCKFEWWGTGWFDVQTRSLIDPRDEAGDAIDSLRFMLPSEGGEYPKSLRESLRFRLDRVRAADPDELIDPWGQPYFYRPHRTGYDLFSSGPDLLPYTDDDVLPGFVTEKCARPVEYVWVANPDAEPPFSDDVANNKAGQRGVLSGCGCASCGP